MFRKTQFKIILTLMIVAVVLLSGMLSVIYLASRNEVRSRNNSLLEHYVENFSLNDFPNGFILHDSEVEPQTDDFPPDKAPENKPDKLYELSTFYAVCYDTDMEVLAIDNNLNSIYSEEDIIRFANTILNEKKNNGVYKNLTYMLDKTEEYTLVVLLDNTVEDDNLNTIVFYTLIFGGITLCVLLALSFFISKQIVSPLEENAKSQKQFLSDAGHELKTPIAVISTNAEMIKRACGNSQWIDNIDYECERISSLIENLLALTKFETVAPEKTEVNFTQLAKRECLLFESVAFEYGHYIREDIQDKVILMGNSEQLTQLVSILLENAISHSDRQGEIKVRLTAANHRVHFTISNPAKPIPPEQKNALFERFYRDDYSRNSDSGHYGLGLAIAKVIVDSHQGSIGVDWKEGYVSFTVILSTGEK